MSKDNDLREYTFNNTGKRKDYNWLEFYTISNKTGNKARQVSGWTVEIENVSGLFVNVHTTRRFRICETVYKRAGKEYKECKVTPIAKVKYDNSLIYKIEVV